MTVGKKQKASVSINLIRILLKYLTKCGIDYDAPCKDAGIDALILNDHEARISTQQFDIIWKEAVKKADDINFGLHFGREIANSYLGGNILFSMMTNSATVGNALEIFCRYHTLMEDSILPKMKVGDDFAFFYGNPSIRTLKFPDIYQKPCCAHTFISFAVLRKIIQACWKSGLDIRARKISESIKRFSSFPYYLISRKMNLCLKKIRLTSRFF